MYMCNVYVCMCMYVCMYVQNRHIAMCVYVCVYVRTYRPVYPNLIPQLQSDLSRLLLTKPVAGTSSRLREDCVTYLIKFYQYTPAVVGTSGRAVYGRSPAEIVGSNPTGAMDVCLL